MLYSRLWSYLTLIIIIIATAVEILQNLHWQMLIYVHVHSTLDLHIHTHKLALSQSSSQLFNVAFYIEKLEGAWCTRLHVSCIDMYNSSRFTDCSSCYRLTGVQCYKIQCHACGYNKTYHNHRCTIYQYMLIRLVPDHFNIIIIIIMHALLKSWGREFSSEILKSSQKSQNPVWNHKNLISKSHTLFWVLQTPQLEEIYNRKLA